LPSAIKDGAGRCAMHPAEVIALEAPVALPQEFPERRYLEDAAKPDTGALVAAGLGATVGILALGAAAQWARRAEGPYLASQVGGGQG
jgi:hypothetical protein